MILEPVYLSYLCGSSLNANMYLADLYKRYAKKHNSEEWIQVNPDKELNEFLINVAENSKYFGPERARQNEDLVRGYHRLDELLEYMHNIIMYEKEYSLTLRKKWDPALHDFHIADSKLIWFQNDIINRTCSIKLKNVLLFGERKINRKLDVDIGTIEVKFSGVKKVDIIGELMADPDANTAFEYFTIENDDKLNFCLLVLVGICRPFILQIEYTDIEVEQIV
ncbi:hypothetical protein DFR55_1632 [Herbinix hemicellulosilytica]|uniref:Uncharacterized protein n=1 Tax=Herbinix hemicellulosilytica TaxID=1564487 RepID=A0A0H5SXN8_HERHM|nr:hypothetical protein [Herbinix hemicellulosilytica]RBP54956.1 hypothetical protein DFR55_1632 [Herbinix hemicellulosilytica]CRZ35118.1 hypothetical protein HHT355_1919 [Herbinix hemicellulosilytica]